MQRCPECDELITAEAINIKEGLALCPRCHNLTRLSELSFNLRSGQEILNQPPAGCLILPTGEGVIVRASLRSASGFLGSAAFALFWNGIVSVFVLIAVAGLYNNLIGPLPDWFPAPIAEQGNVKMNGQAMSLGMTLFLCAFLTPFVTVGVGVATVALLNLIGRVDVVLEESNSYVATGIGRLRWKRKFDPRQVQSVRYGDSAWNSDSPQKVLVLSAERLIKFGSFLQPDRMEWLRLVLRELLVRRDSSRTPLNLPYLTWLRN